MLSMRLSPHQRTHLIEVLVALVLTVAGQANPDPPAPLEAEWYPALIHHQNHPPEEPITLRPLLDRGMGGSVEQWRTLVSAYFQPGEDVDRALCLMGYESGGNPNAYNPSGASGLMQVLSGWADDYGYQKDQLFDPNINLLIAADLKNRFGWTQWAPFNRGLCHE